MSHKIELQPYDILAIEVEARRLRSEFVAQMVSGLWRRIAARIALLRGARHGATA